ncbi:uncharacterized protein LOC133294144 [Gastrolobium bilobum]|uniref:uncharacterized protein LOC133294144 n=1 Tax=Gastrolobium bilobum TaxID=150636 RepID=UPI002AAF5588|nr:uncharacterized protein LOC133294144 [Gastrolobium bilobum]
MKNFLLDNDEQDDRLFWWDPPPDIQILLMADMAAVGRSRAVICTLRYLAYNLVVENRSKHEDLALLFTLVLIVTTLQADAVKEENEKRTKAKRHLLSETALGRKGNLAGGSDPKDLPKKGSATQNTNTADSSNNNQANKSDANGGDDDDDDDANDSFGNYGNGPGSNSHHYYIDVRKPPING